MNSRPSKRSRKALRRHRNNLARRQFQRQLLLNRFARPGPFSCCLVLDHLKPDFNIGKIFRTADALGAREIHLIGTDFFSPRPAKGSFKWVPTLFHDNFAACHRLLRQRGYHFFVLEPGNNLSLTELCMPVNSAFILGHEEFGISFDKGAFPDLQAIKIPQFGKVQSLNVSIAAALVLYEYVRQHGAATPPVTPPPQR